MSSRQKNLVLNFAETKVSVEESMQGWIIRLMKKKMNKKLGDDMEYWLEQLKKESEK